MTPSFSVLDSTNPLTTFSLEKTIFFQLGIIGIGMMITFLWFVPRIQQYRSTKLFDASQHEAIASLNLFQGMRIYLLQWSKILLPYAFNGIAFILLTGTLGILLTDIGWVKAFDNYSFPMNFLMARSSGAANGAHLLSYIPLPFLGVYVAYKYSKNRFLDCYQGILIVAFGVAIHESIWIVAYYIQYAQFMNLGLLPNIIEDICFSGMCVLLIVTFWKYPFRSIPLRVFKLPILLYSIFIAGWLAIGLPLTTINNYQIGHGTFMTTNLWADPLTNAIEIWSWIQISLSFFIVIWRQQK